MSGGFQLVGGGMAQNLVEIATNPFIALFLGLLATSVVQSSSTTTSLIVAIVAVGDLSVTQAVPMILGANIGTALTSTIVSLGHIGNREEFGRAVSAATLHDLFNIISVLFIFWIETLTQGLSRSSVWVANQVGNIHWSGLEGIIFFIKDATDRLIFFLSDWPYLTLFLGLLALFGAFRLLIWIVRWIIIGRVERNLNNILFGSPGRGLLTGFGLTAVMQSSSLTTSLIVPLVATSKVRLEQAFPYIMGANVGTTTTAFLTAMIATGSGRTAALAAALIHVFFNLGGVLLLFPIPKIRRIPVFLAQKLGELCLKSRIYGVAYVILVFFVLPFLLIFLSEGIGWLM